MPISKEERYIEVVRAVALRAGDTLRRLMPNASQLLLFAAILFAGLVSLPQEV
jgi:hypothetical protein